MDALYNPTVEANLMSDEFALAFLGNYQLTPTDRCWHFLSRYRVCEDLGTNLRIAYWRLLALLKYPFYYTIRRGFGNFFGMIHVLTRHLAPELDHFRFCPGFWSMLHFDRNLDIFGDVLTHGYNWAKMRNKRKNQHAKDGTERGQKRPRPADLESLGRPA